MPAVTLDPRYKAKQFTKWMDKQMREYDMNLQDVSRQTGICTASLSNHRMDGKWTLSQIGEIFRLLQADDATVVKFTRDMK